jgi:dihydropteroate synthase
VVRGLHPLGRCRVIGVVNVTPDSFSDGGRHFDAATAIAHGLTLRAGGADIVDVGGESTRPGARRIDAAEEMRRVVPVVRALAAAGVVVSIDTMRRSTAEAALAAGASIVNDVSGGAADPQLPCLVAEARVPYIVMHWRGHSVDMQSRADYTDVVAEVGAELLARLDADQVILDPGIGFAKTAAHNWALLANLDALMALGRPLLIGASRKSFLGALLADEKGPRASDDRAEATVAITALAAAAGVWGARVHEVPANADAVRVVAAIAAARTSIVAGSP